MTFFCPVPRKEGHNVTVNSKGEIVTIINI